MVDRSRQTVVTTGANSGIGLATTIELARLGFRSVGTVRSESKAEVVRERAAAAGLQVETALLDVTDEAGCGEVIERYRPWALINNAGYGGIGAIEDVGDDEARQLIETMVVAPMRLSRLALPRMREAGGGRIVMMSSVLGRTTTALAGWYCGAKHALEALSDALRIEVAGSSVRVILVEPGGFRTGIWEEVYSNIEQRPESSYGRAYRRSAAGLRISTPVMGDPERVAKVVGRALRSRFPQDRYLVGPDAVVLDLTSRLTPTRVKDRFTRLGLGL